MNRILFSFALIIMICFTAFFVLLMYNAIQAKIQSNDPYDYLPDLMLMFSILCLFGLLIFWRELYDSWKEKQIWI